MKIIRYTVYCLLILQAISNALSIDSHITEPNMATIDKSKIYARGEVDTRPIYKGAKSRGKVRPPAAIYPVNEGFRSMGFRFELSPDDNLVDSYTFGIGGVDPNDPHYPGEVSGLYFKTIAGNGKFIYGFSLADLNANCDIKGLPRVKIGDKLKMCVKANAKSGTPDDSDFIVADFIVTNQPLGQESNNLTFHFDNKDTTEPWNGAAEDSISNFLKLMLPIIKDTYGPPSHSNDIGLIRDKTMTGKNVFMADPNEIWTLNFDAQLLTHEFIHAMRDFACLTVNKKWHHDSYLTGFEEGFAQATSFYCMNKFADKYPNDPIWDGSVNYFSSNRSYAYDFDNNELITTTDYWSAGNTDATGLVIKRYAMGATAFHKIFIEDPDFPKHFNAEYYKRLSADSTLYPTRTMLIDIAKTVLTQYGKHGAKIEGRDVINWFDRQRIFDCTVRTGCKIYYNSFFTPNWSGLYSRGKVFYYDTAIDGQEWGSFQNYQYQLHKVNGATGYYQISDWNSNILDKHLVKTSPDVQPDIVKGIGSPGWLMASYPLDITSASFADYLKNYTSGTANSYIQAKNYGLYTSEYYLNHTNGTPVTYREYILMGDSIANYKGICGAIIDDNNKVGIDVSYKNGKIWFTHESSGVEEGPFLVTNGVFRAKTSWSAQPYPFSNVKSKMVKPGQVKIRFVNDLTQKQYLDYRNVEFGNFNGSMSFLFREKEMLNPDGTEQSSSVTANEPEKFSLNQNYPNPFNPITTIEYNLAKDSKVKLEVINIKGELVKELVNGTVNAGSHHLTFNGQDLNSGVYFYKLTIDQQSTVKKMVLIK